MHTCLLAVVELIHAYLHIVLLAIVVIILNTARMLLIVGYFVPCTLHMVSEYLRQLCLYLDLPQKPIDP